MSLSSWGRSRKRAGRVLWCQLAYPLGFLRNQLCSAGFEASPLFV